ncbi:MAG: alpha/beta fold hydrolase, partial [Anaerolineae bacterium]|nr:alpha/beta fold hydrolase [Anaerolineae bacterium]
VLPWVFLQPGRDFFSEAPLALVLAAGLLPGAGMLIGVWWGLRFHHRRPFASLIAPRGSFRWGRLAKAMGWWLLMIALVDLAQFIVDPQAYRWSFEPGRFLLQLPVLLLLLPAQVAGEEVVFRGYFTQMLGVRGRSVWLPVVIPALVFGLLHISNPEVSAYGVALTLPGYILMGLLLGVVTVRSQGLEEALGIHLANNVYASMISGVPSGALATNLLLTNDRFNPMLNLFLMMLACAAYVLVTTRKTRLAGALAVVLLAGCSAAPAMTQASQAQPTLALEPCLLSSPGLSRRVDARCGTLNVPENPADPQGRQIGLRVAVIKASSSNPEPDPIFLLAGGPGQAASQAFLPILPALERSTFKRDVVLVDQRGTGGSGALTCPESLNAEAPIDYFPTPQEMAAEYRACLDGLDADPRYYTTDLSMQDIDAVRAALGYDQINLMGVSYGTRAAMAYMRLYPEHVRTAVLDAVVPPNWVLGASVRRDAQSALEIIFARCAADEACQKAFPDLPGDFDGLMARLREKPETVTLPDPITAKDTTLTVSPEIAGAMVRLISYSSDFSALLPWLIHTAAEGDLRPLASQYLISATSSGAGIEYGLFFAVVCSEDIPFLPPEGELGDYFFYKIDESWRAVCAEYPSNPQSEADRVYPNLDTQTLILSGEADPVTPPANGALAASYLPNSMHLVLPGQGHGNLAVGCVPNLIRQMLENGTVEGLDASCIERAQPLPFFISAVGPQP